MCWRDGAALGISEMMDTDNECGVVDGPLGAKTRMVMTDVRERRWGDETSRCRNGMSFAREQYFEAFENESEERRTWCKVCPWH